MNNILLVGTALTIRSSNVADIFYAACMKELQSYTTVSILRSTRALRTASPDGGDAVLFFNRTDQAYERDFTRFLDKSLRGGALIFPVAVSRAERHPPNLVQQRQSFDIVEQLRQRALDSSQVGIVATVLARQVLASLKPTLSVEPMHLFLSHRRLDGEEIAAVFQRDLITSARHAFRDLFDVQVGEDAQELIEKRLRKSDAVIFLDTPKSGESEWISWS